jgi:hypothetical protein
VCFFGAQRVSKSSNVSKMFFVVGCFFFLLTGKISKVGFSASFISSSKQIKEYPSKVHLILFNIFSLQRFFSS